MNNNNPLNEEILHFYHNIQYCQQMIASSTNLCQRIFYKNILDNQISQLNYWQRYYQQTNILNNQENEADLLNQREFTIDELAEFDGSGGKPAYVAVNGIVYDVSLESTWGGGTHFSLYAGKDLTDQFNGCHGGMLAVLRNLNQVGVLK